MMRALDQNLKRISITHLWVLVALGAMLWIAMGTPLPPLDFWWHLKAGEVIWSTRSIPRVDAFSFTAWGQDFVYQNWLSEVIYYVTYLVGGLPLLICLHAVTFVLSFGIVLWLSWLVTDHPRLAVLCTLVGEVLAIRFTNARPQIFSMLFFSIFYFVLQRYRHYPGRVPWLLIPLMALWVNMHGAFVLAIGLVALFTGMELAKASFSARGALARRQIARLGLILLLLVLASLLSPEGWRVYKYIWDVQTDPASQKLVTEWQSPAIRNPGDLPFFATIFVGFLAFIYSAKRDLTDLVLFCSFASLGLASLRGIIWFALILPPILAAQLKNLDLAPLQRTVGRWRTRGGSRSTAPAHSALNLLTLVLLAGITLLLSPWVRPGLSNPRLRSELIDPRIPREAVEFIAQEGIQGHIFHSQEVGDYLIWRLHPQQHSFVDGRVHLYDVEFCRDYLRISNGCGWEELLAQYDVEWVLLPQDGEDRELLQQGLERARDWEQIYADDQAVLYRKISFGES
jgi:hypothetical protein